MSNQAFARTTTDHIEIKKWAEERGGQPAIIRSAINTESCSPSICFPGREEKHHEQVSWSRFFNLFDSRRLQFIYMDEPGGRKESKFFKLIPA